jgi:hypothetical protein
VASPFLASSWEHFPAVNWVAPSFVFSHNMSHSDNGQTVAAAVTCQVKLCPKMRRNWPSGSASSRGSSPQQASNLKSSGTPMLWPAFLSKSFRTFLDTVYVCNESDQPFDLLKEVLLGQFRKSKWQSYF